MSGVDREKLTHFMESKTGYAPAGGEMVGILKTMNDGMTVDFTDATDSENAASASFDELIATKTKEIDALTASIASQDSSQPRSHTSSTSTGLSRRPSRSH